MTLAVDFDGTVVEQAYPEIGSLKPDAKEVLNQLAKDGHFIIIWTCRTGAFLLKAELFLIENQVTYHKINQHHPSDLLTYQDFGPKIGADLYIDDKNIGGIPSWKQIYQIIKQKVDEQINIR